MKNPRLFFDHPILFYIRQEWIFFFSGLFFLLITNFLDAVSPFFFKSIIDELAKSGPEQSVILHQSLYFFLCLSGLAMTRLLWRTLFGRYHTYSAEDLRNRIFQYWLHQSPGYFQKNQIGELMSLITNDVQAFRQTLGMAILTLFDAFSIVAMVIPMMLYLKVDWTYKTLVFLPFLPLVINILHKKIFKACKKEQELLSNLSSYTQETVSGIRVIKSYVQESARLQKYNEVSHLYEKACIKVGLIDSLWGPIMQTSVIVGTAILIYVGSNDVITGVATLGTFVAYQRYISKMVWPMTALGFGLSQYQKGMASWARIREQLQTLNVVEDKGELKLQKVQSIEFRNVSFSFENQSILKNINFRIQRGETLGLMGAVGAGKSTLLNLLTRQYPLAQGQILINDIPIEQYQLSELYRAITLVPQESFLLSESIQENLNWVLEKDLEKNEFDHLIESVQLHEEINILPHKERSQLGEKGINLSGGQKQRLSLARGAVRKSEVILFDDTLSAVDVTTEERIEKALFSKNKSEQIRIIAAHRLSTLKNADRILILKEGEIEALGSSETLSSTSETFRKLKELQSLT